jgi:hypothetical protein
VKTFRSSTLILRTSLVALTLVAAATLANAGSITFTATVPQQLTDLASVPLAPPLPLFNFSNSLTGVTITIQGVGTTTFNTITNNGGSTGTFIDAQSTSLWLDDANNASINTLLGPLTATISASTPGSVGLHSVITGGTTLAAGASGGPYGPYVMGGALASESFSSPADLALFQGTPGGGGLLDFVMNTFSLNSFTTNGSGNFNALYSEIAGGTITITYDYSGPPVVTPEPGTLGLFGTGLLGLAGLVRFKFMKSR